MEKELDQKNQQNDTSTEKCQETESLQDEVSQKKYEDEKKNSEKNLELTPDEKIQELEDKLARAFAEMENQRRRFEKEKDDAFDYGGFLFAKEALNIIDNLERSKQALENDQNLKDTEALKKALEHLEIIHKDIISIFLKNNIKSIDCLNKKLDPNLHQAMMEIENNEKEAGTIIQEIQKGFMIKDRLLRPSLVGVSKKTDITNEKDQQNKTKSLDKK